MNRAWWLVAFFGLCGLAQIAGGDWASGAVAAAGFGWWAFSTYRWLKGRRSSGSAAEPSLAGLPDPPSRTEYRAAGVDMKSCSKCRKSLKTVGYFFGKGGFPTVYCPSCWSKAADPYHTDRYDNHFDSLTTKYDRREL